MADWQPGDLALCVNNGELRFADGAWSGKREELIVGRVYEVLDCGPDGADPRFFKTCLMLRGVKSRGRRGGYYHGRFRKVTPGADIEGFEERRRLPVKEDA